MSYNRKADASWVLVNLLIAVVGLLCLWLYALPVKPHG